MFNTEQFPRHHYTGSFGKRFAYQCVWLSYVHMPIHEEQQSEFCFDEKNNIRLGIMFTVCEWIISLFGKCLSYPCSWLGSLSSSVGILLNECFRFLGGGIVWIATFWFFFQLPQGTQKKKLFFLLNYIVCWIHFIQWLFLFLLLFSQKCYVCMVISVWTLVSIQYSFGGTETTLNKNHIVFLGKSVLQQAMWILLWFYLTFSFFGFCQTSGSIHLFFICFDWLS